MPTVFIVTVRDSVLDVVLAFDHDPLDEEIVAVYNEEMEADIEDIYDLEVLSVVETVIYGEQNDKK